MEVLIAIVPSAIRMDSLASRASDVQLILRVPPVTLMSSLLLIPLSVEEMLRVPVPFRTTSSLEKMTASVLVVSSAVKVPVTDSVFSESVVVTKTLSAFFT